MALNPS